MNRSDLRDHGYYAPTPAPEPGTWNVFRVAGAVEHDVPWSGLPWPIKSYLYHRADNR